MAVLIAAIPNGFTYGQAADLINLLSEQGSPVDTLRLCEEAIDKAGPEALATAQRAMWNTG